MSPKKNIRTKDTSMAVEKWVVVGKKIQRRSVVFLDKKHYILLPKNGGSSAKVIRDRRWGSAREVFSTAAEAEETIKGDLVRWLVIEEQNDIRIVRVKAYDLTNWRPIYVLDEPVRYLPKSWVKRNTYKRNPPSSKGLDGKRCIRPSGIYYECLNRKEAVKYAKDRLQEVIARKKFEQKMAEETIAKAQKLLAGVK